MTLEEVTQKIERAVWNKIPKEQSPTDLWTGIGFIKKQASGGATTIEEGGDGGGDGCKTLSLIVNWTQTRGGVLYISCIDI